MSNEQQIPKVFVAFNEGHQLRRYTRQSEDAWLEETFRNGVFDFNDVVGDGTVVNVLADSDQIFVLQPRSA